MYLKNIEIHGFKSFANKIQLKFEQGITGIVGPNGSGKSNIADAVRWVLGEQSAKQLRGAKMEDVIFAGTENRKPLGFGQVSITIDNSDGKLPIDYTEVTVTRRVYRSGESEYAINGTTCRLKDVHELFFDTGIGKEGYSIIGQGQIDKILSSKPEDRRDLFDEAAGIVKFKKRRELAEKKLQEEKQNLLRVQDILLEIEHQLGPLQGQAEVAKEYLEYKEALKKLDINIFLQEIDHIKEEEGTLEEKEKIAQNDFKEAEECMASTKEKHDLLEQELEHLTEKIDGIKNNIADAQLNREKIENQINITKEQISSVKNSNVHISNRLAAIEEKLHEYQNEATVFETKKNELDEDFTKNHGALQNIESELEENAIKIADQNNKIEEIKANIIEGLNNISNLNSKIQRFETMKEHINIRKSELHQKYIKIRQEEEVSQQKIDEHQTDYTMLVDQMNQIATTKEKSEDALKRIKNEKQNLLNDLNQKQNYLHQMSSKYEALKGITEQYEGYNFSIRKIMELKQSNHPLNKGVLGVVADVIEVDKKYELAIEIALGGSIQHIITQDESVAKNLVNYLKQNKYGRATFLPLSSVSSKGSFKTHEVLKEKGVIQVASELVKSEEAYKHLIEFLLGRVIIVEDMDSAVLIAKKYNQSLRLVTLGGELLSPGGSITGGSYKNNQHFLSRKREMDDLEITLKDLQAEIEKYTVLKQEQETKEVVLLEEYEAIKNSIQDYKLKHHTSQMALEQMKAKIKDIQETKEDIQKEIEELDHQYKDVMQKMAELKEELEILEGQNKSFDEQIKSIHTAMDDDQKLYTSKQEKLTEYKIKISSLQQEINHIKDNYNRLLKDKANLVEEQKTLLASIEQNELEIIQKQESIIILQEQMEQDRLLMREREEQLQQWIQHKEEKNKNLKEYFKERESITERINLLDKEIFRLNAQKEKYMEQSEQLISYMWNEYEMTLNHALNFKSETESSLTTMKKEVHDLKQKIKALGDINVNAIEDYKNLVERFEFLTTQREDLLTAEEKLLDIIAELDEAMRIQFKEKFNEINEQFNQVFKELFGGGRGILELTNSDDVLEAGIKIVAQPPGKKLQNMMLLSGGERAFTAIALLFAIQRLKPSPFCVLDEIEAALDDANVDRFAQYLHKLSQHTQFIIITHRKGTMESADALYGITMQEKGVSTLVSVKLIENEISESLA
jgi:chromosome segregation protein